jgi:hypothetical protein
MKRNAFKPARLGATTGQTSLTTLLGRRLPLGIDAAFGSRDIPESTIERR